MERLAEASREGLRTDLPAFEPGDTVRVMVRVKEGEKERLQAFEGIVVAKRGRRDQRELHRPEGLGRRGRRADLPDPQPEHRLGGAGAPRPGTPRQALLPAPAERQGSPDPGEARALIMRAPVPTLAREAAAWAEGCLLVGVDEVGRGPLAGPVVAAAVVFPAGCPRGTLRGLRDSKLLPPERRARLARRSAPAPSPSVSARRRSPRSIGSTSAAPPRWPCAGRSPA